MCAQLNTIILRDGVDPVTMPEVPPYPNQLTRPWEPEEPPYEEKKEDDDEEADE